MSDNTQKNRWSDLNETEMRSICDMVEKLNCHSTECLNHYARLMTNWLYALSAAGVGLCLIYKHTAKVSLILFAIGLVFALTWAVLEYIRANLIITKQKMAWGNLLEHNDYIDNFFSKIGKDSRALFWCITIVAIAGYVLLFLAFILFFMC